MNACDVIGYTYDADYHCTGCAIDRYGEHPRSPWVHRWANTEGAEDAAPIFADSEWWNRDDDAPQVLSCGTCGETIATLDGDGQAVASCAECGGTGAVPAANPEEEQDNGHAPCPECRDSVADVLARYGYRISDSGRAVRK